MKSNRPFQLDRFKYNTDNQFDIYNPEFESAIKAVDDETVEKTDEMMEYHLNLYQRVMLRMFFRFKNNYIVISRGSAKTFTELLALMVKAIMYPSIRLSVTAESKEQASNILKDKFAEITDSWFPFFKSEIVKATFSKDTASIVFQNGSIIDVLGAVQTSKGLRRNQGSIEESVRINAFTLSDVIVPIFNIPRRTASGDIDKKELHGALNFMTTSGFKGTEEHRRNLQMVDEMAECKGSFVFGADWQLPVFFGLMTKKFVLDIRNDPTTSPTAFAMNYMSVWTGASDNALIGMDKIVALRKPSLKAELRTKDTSEYVISCDVARSKAESNNQTAIVVGKLRRNKDNSIKGVDICNIIIPPNGLSFYEQCLILKRMQKAYNAIAVTIDTNGLGKGLADYCVEELEDRETGEVFEAWDCMNDETFKCKTQNAPKILYSLNATGINTQIIVNFWDYVESMKLNLLPNEKNAKVDEKLPEQEQANLLSIHMRTDTLLEQISNLEVENVNGKYRLKQVSKRIDKDIFSALIYLLYYVQVCENNKNKNTANYFDYIYFN
jgi:hypothetical protein